MNNISFNQFKTSKYKILRMVAHTCTPKVLLSHGTRSNGWAVVLPIPRMSLITSYIKKKILDAATQYNMS